MKRDEKFVDDVCRIVGHDFPDKPFPDCLRCGKEGLTGLLRKDLDKFVGQKITSDTVEMMQRYTYASLVNKVQNGTIDSFRNLNVKQDPTYPGRIWINVEVYYNLQYITATFTL